MKKCFVIGLIMAMVPGMCPAAYTRISDLTAQKLEKMKKLEKCQGTTKGLKIAGLSTLGLTAVGVAGNIAEAVVLNEYKDKVKKEKKEYQTQADLNKSLLAQHDTESAQTQSKQPEQKNSVASEKCNNNKIMKDFKQNIFDNVANHCFGEYKPSGISYQDLLSFVEESKNKLKEQGYSVTDGYFPLTHRRELTWSDDGVEYRANFLFSDIKCSDDLFVNREQNKCQKEKPADNEIKDQEKEQPVIINRFARDIVTQQGAMEKISQYDKEMGDITLTSCDSPSKSSISDDAYDDTIVCHGTDKDYVFRFGRIDKQAEIKLNKPSILNFDAPKVGVKLPSLINDVQAKQAEEQQQREQEIKIESGAAHLVPGKQYEK